MSLFKQTTKRSLISVLILGLWSGSALATSDSSSISRSISYAGSDTSTTEIDTLLKQTAPVKYSPLSKQGYRSESLSAEKQITLQSYSTSIDYSIYNVSSSLVIDNDYDGFYHHFSISIDVDTVYSSALVYARLYLSYEGGPWNYYASSADYYINGDSSLDSFVIDTVLDDGYAPGYYDIRIEIYDAYTDQWLLSYGPYDDYSISALPLEDNFHDGDYIDSGYTGGRDVVIVSGGSMGGILIMVSAFLITLLRRAYSSKSATGSTRKVIHKK